MPINTPGPRTPVLEEISQAHMNSTAEEGRARTLLNVEDYEPSRFLRTRVLRAAGFNVIEAASAAEALTAASHETLSVALVDVNLPDSNGIVLCDTLKRLRPGLPVLLISAISLSDEARNAGLAAGADAYLGEPLGREHLVRSVEEALERVTAREPSEAWVVTDCQGFILDASREGAAVLSGTPRGLLQRNLLIFFDQDRDAWREAMARAGEGDRVVRSGRLRPRERRPVRVRARIEAASEWGRRALLWSFERE
jgi:CheY-like chemotaxis protein